MGRRVTRGGDDTLRPGAVTQARLPHPRRRPRPDRRAPGELRALGEREGGAAGVDVLTATPPRPRPPPPRSRDDVRHGSSRPRGRRRGALRRGRRQEHLVPALTDIPPDTTIAFFGARRGASRRPGARDGRRRPRGDVRDEATMKARELPKWLQGEASRLGVELDRDGRRRSSARRRPPAAPAREVEKLALELGPDAHIGREVVEDAAAHCSERQVWALVDALVAATAARDARVPQLRRRASRPPPRALSRAGPRRARDRPAPGGGGVRRRVKVDQGSPWMTDRGSPRRALGRLPLSSRSRCSPTSSWTPTAPPSSPTTRSACGRSPRSRAPAPDSALAGLDEAGLVGEHDRLHAVARGRAWSGCG